MVIQCPVCSTKFSIDNSEIASRRDPQFHCSRCDCLFDLKGKSKSSTAKSKSLAESIVTSSNHGNESPIMESISDSKDMGIQGSIFEEELMEPASIPLDDSLITEEKQLAFFNAISEAAPNVKSKHSMLRFDDDDSSIYREELPLIAAEWPDSRADRDLEIDLGEVTRRSIPFASTAKNLNLESNAITLPNRPGLIESELVNSTAPRLAIPPKQNWKNIPEETQTGSNLASDSQSDKPGRTENIQRIFDELEKSDRPAEIESINLKERYKDSIPTFLAKDQGAVLTFPNRDKIKAEPKDAPAKRFLRKKSELPASMLQAMKFDAGLLSTSSLRSLSLFLIGPAISTLALYAASLSSVTTLIPGKSNSLKVPPSGLEIQDLKSEVKILADGMRFLEVTGNIQNNTPATYADVELIARGFDYQNQKSSEILVSVNNGLQHLENAEALKSDMLLRLQKEKGINRAIKPNERIEIKLALPIETEIPAYFDTEIFGVKKS